MQQAQIIYPLVAMVGLTFMVAFATLRLRMRAVARGEINPRYFLLNRGGKVPDYLARVEQHYLNLLELPVLFYALCLTLLVTDSVTLLQLVLAWGFVVTRVVHTLIHTTVNWLRWRIWAFVSGGVLLFSGWALLVITLIDG